MKLKFNRRLDAGVAIVALMASTAAGPVQAETPSDTLVVAQNIAGATSIDPAHGGTGMVSNWLMSVCDPLLKRGRVDYNAIEPGLAESWEVAPDRSKVTFHLRKNAVFPSGNPVTAADTLYSIERLFKINAGGAADWIQFGFTADNFHSLITAPDDYTIEVKFPGPLPVDAFLYFVGGGVTTFTHDSKTLKSYEVDGDYGKAWLQTTTACVGPYRMEFNRPGEAVGFVRNDEYYGKKPSLTRILFQNIPESATQRLLLERGDVDVAVDLNATDLEALSKSKTARVEGILSHAVMEITFNSSNPVFADPRVTEAFKYLVDYKGLLNTVLKDYAIQRNSLVPSGAFGALDEKAGAPYELDLERAKKLISDAGYPDGFSASLYSVMIPGFPEVAQHLQANAAKIGVKLDVQPKQDSDLFPLYRARKYDAVLVRWDSLYPDADAMVSRFAYNPDNRFEANQTFFPTWRAAWSSDWFNKATMDAKAEQDPAKRVALYTEIQERWMKEAPFGMLFQMVRRIGLSNSVKSMPRSPFNPDYFGDAVKG
jgi:peptide/nickel transport system substrate-binding protein